jgi:hypothetical protein
LPWVKYWSRSFTQFGWLMSWIIWCSLFL